MIEQPQPAARPPRLVSLVIRWLITTLAIFVAIYIVPGITFAGEGWQLGIVALLLALVNMAVRPLLTLLTCPLIILTLGLFSLVVNAVLLLLTAQLATTLGVNFTITSFFSAVLGSIIISVVSLILNILAGEVARPVVVIRRQE